MSRRRLASRVAAVRAWLAGVAFSRRLVALLGVAVLAVLAAPAVVAATDVFSNVGPASQVRGSSLMDAYPLSHYALDIHFKAVDAGVLSGVDMSGLAPTIAWFLASLVWELTAFVAKATITLFTFAFSLDLVGDGSRTSGALAPVSDAVRSIYRTVFGGPWLTAAVAVTGIWAMWQALVRRRYTETAGALAVSLGFLVIALAFVTQPERTIGQASKWTNDLSGAFLSISSQGSIGNPERAKREAADQLFEVLVHDPWVVLQFGGLEHCVKAGTEDGDDPVSVPVRPLSTNPARDAALARRLASSEQVRGDGKVCVNNAHRYAHRFLKHRPHSDERRDHYDALRDGDTGKAPDSDRDGYTLSGIDRPAAEAMGKTGQYQRLLLALVILAGEIGIFALLGSLSVAVVMAQVLVLLLLAFAPVALVAGVIPGRGHDFFKGWLARLAGFLARKAVYSLILATLLAVASAVADATSNLGWLMAFGLQAAFFWTVFLFRRQLGGQATGLLAGPNATGRDASPARLASVYAAAHIAARAVTRTTRTTHSLRRPNPPDNRPATTTPVAPPDIDQTPAADTRRDSDPRDRENNAPSPAPAGRPNKEPAARSLDDGPPTAAPPATDDRSDIDGTDADLDREGEDTDDPPRRGTAGHSRPQSERPAGDATQPARDPAAPSTPPLVNRGERPDLAPDAPINEITGQQGDRDRTSPLAADLRADIDRARRRTEPVESGPLPLPPEDGASRPKSPRGPLPEPPGPPPRREKGDDDRRDADTGEGRS